jgi:hypothetical protein
MKIAADMRNLPLRVGTHREIARLETNSIDDSAATTMKGIDNLDFAGGVIWLMQRELAELKEMVRLGAGLPGDEQRIEMIKGLLGAIFGEGADL